MQALIGVVHLLKVSVAPVSPSQVWEMGLEQSQQKSSFGRCAPDVASGLISILQSECSLIEHLALLPPPYITTTPEVPDAPVFSAPRMGLGMEWA